jgi:type I restriction enzyme S subunit
MCEFVIDCPHFTPEWTTSGFIVIRNQNIRDGRLDLTDPSFTHKEDFNRRNRRAKPKAGDIIFTREAPMGEVCIVPAGLECCIGQRQVLLRPRSDVDSRYLFYALRSNYVRHQIFWNEGTGSTVSNVRIPVLEALKIPRLGTSEFETASILAALDDKIELNRQMNETLEAMARAIFKDWFVDFGPTRAKMAGSKPYLAPEIWKLFPDRLDDEGKPEGWTAQPLTELIHLIGGSTPKTSIAEYWHGEIPWFSVTDVPSPSDVFVISTDKSISKAGLDSCSSNLLPVGTTIITARGTVGKLALVGTEMAMNQSCYGITGKNHWPDYFIHFLVKTAILDLQARTHGSVFDTITRATFESVVVVQPSLAQAHAFEASVTPLLERIHSNLKEAETLSATRDLLLPKLMSGEIRLRDAALTAEAVLAKAS